MWKTFSRKRKIKNVSVKWYFQICLLARLVIEYTSGTRFWQCSIKVGTHQLQQHVAATDDSMSTGQATIEVWPYFLKPERQIASCVLENFCENLCLRNRILPLQQVAKNYIRLHLCYLLRRQRFSQNFFSTDSVYRPDIWTVLTWDQALFSFRFVNNIPAGMAKRKERMYENRSNWAWSQVRAV